MKNFFRWVWAIIEGIGIGLILPAWLVLCVFVSVNDHWSSWVFYVVIVGIPVLVFAILIISHFFED